MDYAGRVKREAGEAREESRAGLCATCAKARRIESVRGSEFLLCELWKSDPRFAKYPRLPVLECAGYQRKEAAASRE